MNASYDNSSAVVVLPPVSGGRLRNKSLRAWLAQSDLTQASAPEALLALVTQTVQLPYPEQGLAALRMWGQTNDRPTYWMAAADPVYLEPQMSNLCLHSLRRPGVPADQMDALIDHLQETLADGTAFGFVRVGSYSYLSSSKPIATASVPAYIVDQQVPMEFLPTGDDVADYRNLVSEIEMALHEHDVNERRVDEGLQPVNSLWLWGGGTAPEKIIRQQPPLFSDDALLTGYWYSATAFAAPWPGDIESCLEASVAGFVATTPEFDDDPALLESCLLELRAALRSGRLSRLILLFRDGLRAEVRRSHRLRFWRRTSDLLDGVASG